MDRVPDLIVALDPSVMKYCVITVKRRPPMSSNLSLSLATTWLSGQSDNPIADFLTNKPDGSLFLDTKPRITPFSFLYTEQAPKENAVHYNGTATFPLDKVGDLISNLYLVIKTTPLLYMPIRDENITRACCLADLPNEPVSEYLGGLSRLDTQAVWVDYMAYAMLDRATFGVPGAQAVETVTGDSLFLVNDTSRRQDQSFVTTLPDNQGGANNLGNGAQRLYVPLLFSFCKSFRDAFPIRAAHQCQPQVRVDLGPAPFRGDATFFQPPTFDPVACADYAANPGPDILPHQMYERYAELRAGSLSGVVAVSSVFTNASQRLQGDFLPAISLQFQAAGLDPITTTNSSVRANAIKLPRRKTFRFDVSALQNLQEPALVQTGTSAQAYLWDYANTAPLVGFSPVNASSRTAPAEPTSASLRLYGSLPAGAADQQITITYAGMQAYQVTVQDLGSGTAPSTSVDQMPPNAAQSWAGAGMVPIPNVPGGMMGFRIDPYVQGQLQNGDTWNVTVGRRGLPLTFVPSDQPWGDALPADYYEAPAGTTSVMFTYSGALTTDDARLHLDVKSAGSLPGFQFPAWLSTLDNGNILYYHTGSSTPAVLRSALGGTIVGVFSDDLNWDYLRADPGQRVDALSPQTGNTLVATDATGLFHPLFQGMLGRPAVGSFPNGISNLPVYCYNVMDDPTYHEAVYKPVVVGQSLQRFQGPSSTVGGELDKVALSICNIFLGKEESEYKASQPYQQLFGDLQYQQTRLVAGSKGPFRVKINLVGPVKALVFFFRPDDNDMRTGGTHSESYWSWSLTDANKDQDLFEDATLVLNNQALYSPPRDPVFFKHLMPTQFRTSTPRQRCYTMPFNANPDCDNPYGSLNLSLYDSVELVLNFSNGNVLGDTGTLWVYGDTYNVFQIRQGMLGRVFVH